MKLTKKSIEALLDLIEIKLSCIQVIDREDAREVKTLQMAREELCGLIGVAPKGDIVPLNALAEAAKTPRAREARQRTA